MFEFLFEFSFLEKTKKKTGKNFFSPVGAATIAQRQRSVAQRGRRGNGRKKFIFSPFFLFFLKKKIQTKIHKLIPTPQGFIALAGAGGRGRRWRSLLAPVLALARLALALALPLAGAGAGAGGTGCASADGAGGSGWGWRARRGRRMTLPRLGRSESAWGSAEEAPGRPRLGECAGTLPPRTQTRPHSPRDSCHRVHSRGSCGPRCLWTRENGVCQLLQK